MELIKKHIKKILGVLLIIIFISGLSLKCYLKSNEKNIKKEKTTNIKLTSEIKESEEKKEKVFVDIKGAIKKPGVYEMDNDKKIIDVVTEAGGLTNEADTTYINLAKKITNEMVILIYTKDQIKESKKKETFSIINEETCICPVIKNDACITETTKSNKTTTSQSKSSTNSKPNSNDNTSTNTSTKVNINTASLEELQTLAGIGESKAKSIMAYREENGNYNSPEEILNVSGIGESIYEKIKDNITV